MKHNFLSLLALIFVLALGACQHSDISYKLIPVKSGDKWGYIDKQGKMQINPQFEEAAVFLEGLARVKSSDGKVGFINEDGKYVINPIYKDAGCFFDDWAVVVADNSAPQFIDKNGNVKLTVNNVDLCGAFCEGLALISSKGKWGFIDKKGEIKIPAKYDVATYFSEGLAAVMIKNASGDSLWGYINTKGDVVINCQFREAYLFRNECAAVVSENNKLGYINKQGKYIISPQFDKGGPFDKEWATVKLGQQCGYINKDGKMQINPQFVWAGRFGENDLAVAENADEKMGYIDKKGKYVITPQFESASPFFNDFAFVLSSGKYGLIGKDGKYLVNPQFDDINIDQMEDLKGKLITSDIVDLTTVSELISNNFTSNSFNGLSSSSTFSFLATLFPQIKEDNVEANKVTLTDKIPVTHNVALQNINFEFAGNLYEVKDIYRTTTTANSYEERYDHTQKSFYRNVPLMSVNFDISFESSAGGKAKLLFEKLKSQIEQKTGGRVTRTNITLNDNELEDDGNALLMADDIAVFMSYNENYVHMTVVFSKKGIEQMRKLYP